MSLLAQNNDDEELIIENSLSFSDIGNYYGTLNIAEQSGRFYWGIEDHSSTEYKQIPEYLYEALRKYYNHTTYNSLRGNTQ